MWPGRATLSVASLPARINISRELLSASSLIVYAVARQVM